MAGARVQKVPAHCAASQSVKATCASLPHVSPTAVTSAISVTASSVSRYSKTGRGHRDGERKRALIETQPFGVLQPLRLAYQLLDPLVREANTKYGKPAARILDSCQSRGCIA